MNLNNSSPCPFPMEKINYDHDQHHHAFATNHQLSVSSSSSSSASCHFLFSSTQDHAGYNSRQPDHHRKDDKYACNNLGGSSSYEIKNNSGLKLTLWKKELDQGPEEIKANTPPKWMPPKLRLMKRAMINFTAPKTNLEDHHRDQNNLQPTTNKYFETDHHVSSNNSTTSSYYSSSSPIRVCSDCHTTKTPLWRSGPKGPKSLCNACGIRQRKARRAMAAAAAAAANGGAAAVAVDHQAPAARMKIKEHQMKEKKKSKTGKRIKMATHDAAGSGSSSVSRGQKNNKLNLEDFLIHLSNNLALQRVFPEDEKDAAILLMALSSGLVHG